MGLFGLGVPELAVIGAVTALAFGACLHTLLTTVCMLCTFLLHRCEGSVLKQEGMSTNHLSLAGPSKLPELGKVLGQTVKSFQGAAKVRPACTSGQHHNQDQDQTGFNKKHALHRSSRQS